LILVIMITALTLVSSLVVSWIDITENTSSYHVTEAELVAGDMDACVNDALARISSSTSVSGNYNLFTTDISCTYEISSTSNNIKIVTSTASSTSDLGYWADQVIMHVDVGTTPISIYTYKTDLNAYASLVSCGDGDCGGSEDCGSCSADCGACVCGDGVTEGDEVCDDDDTFTEGCGTGVTETAGTYCNSDCTAEIVIGDDEVCDDGDTDTETQTCGNGSQENGTFCNADCSTVINLTEACDDGDTYTEGCGNGTKESGTFCNASCTSVLNLSETCDFDYWTNDCETMIMGVYATVNDTGRSYCLENCALYKSKCR